MPKIKYVSAQGDETIVDVPVGSSVMLGAVDNAIEGIIGECGGLRNCGTCHCYVEESWLDQLSVPDPEELMMLEDVDEYKDNSRLGCQIKITEQLDGLTVYLPKSQG